MNATSGNHGMSDASLRARSPAELIHLVRKLRWMGLDEEAARMEALLAELPRAESVLAGPIDTD
jgi:hypothetical protein